MKLGARDLAAVTGLLVLGVALPTVIALAAGAIDIPRNDDWSFRGIALDLYETGRLQVDGWVAPLLVGHILLAQPFLWLTGGASWVFTAVGVLAAVVTVAAAYLLVRRLVPAGRTTLAVLLLVLFPGFLPYVPTYMTDLPAMGAAFVCLGLGIVAVTGGHIRGRWLVASMIVGIFGFTVREFAAAAPASVLAAAVFVQPRRWTPWLSAFAVVACCATIYYLRIQLPGHIVTVHPISDYYADRVARAVSSLAFVLLPAVVLAAASWWRHWRPTDVLVGAILGTYLLRERLGDLIADQKMPPVLLDNLTSQWGSPLQFMTLGSRPLLFSDVVWSAVNGIALFATIFLFAVAGGVLGIHARKALRVPRAVPGHLASPGGIVFMFCVAMGIGLVVFGLTGTMFDRYLWPLVPTAAGLLLMRPLVRQQVAPREAATEAHRPVGALPVVATVASVVVLVAIALPLMLNSAAFDRARWSAAERLVDLGVPAESIDAGYEWVGYHATTRADFAHQVPAPTWWEGLWPSFRLCGYVATAPHVLPGARVEKIDLHAYRLMLFVGADEPLYLYRMTDPRCAR